MPKKNLKRRVGIVCAVMGIRDSALAAFSGAPRTGGGTFDRRFAGSRLEFEKSNRRTDVVDACEVQTSVTHKLGRIVVALR
jgi:hypothetical protein